MRVSTTSWTAWWNSGSPGFLFMRPFIKLSNSWLVESDINWPFSSCVNLYWHGKWINLIKCRILSWLVNMYYFSLSQCEWYAWPAISSIDAMRPTTSSGRSSASTGTTPTTSLFDCVHFMVRITWLIQPHPYPGAWQWSNDHFTRYKKAGSSHPAHAQMKLSIGWHFQRKRAAIPIPQLMESLTRKISLDLVMRWGGRSNGERRENKTNAWRGLSCRRLDSGHRGKWN